MMAVPGVPCMSGVLASVAGARVAASAVWL